MGKRIFSKFSFVFAALLPLLYLVLVCLLVVTALYLMWGEWGLISAVPACLSLFVVVFFYGDRFLLNYVKARPLSDMKNYRDVSNMVSQIAFNFNKEIPALYLTKNISPNAYVLNSFFASGHGAIVIDECILNYSKEELKTVLAHSVVRVDHFATRAATAVGTFAFLLTLPQDLILKVNRRLPQLNGMLKFLSLGISTVTTAIESLMINLAISSSALDFADSMIVKRLGIESLRTALFKVEHERLNSRASFTKLLPMAFCDNITHGTNFFLFNRYPSIEKRIERYS